jgi:hypothetical protein
LKENNQSTPDLEFKTAFAVLVNNKTLLAHRATLIGTLTSPDHFLLVILIIIVIRINHYD